LSANIQDNFGKPVPKYQTVQDIAAARDSGGGAKNVVSLKSAYRRNYETFSAFNAL